MIKRVALVEKKPEKVEKNLFFSAPKTDRIFSTGCTLLDLIMGGGPMLGRTYNIVGDWSSSKTGIATESMIGFNRAFPEATRPHYDETEAAFDHDFASAIGLSRDAYTASEKRTRTVSDLMANIKTYCNKVDPKYGGFYIVDSFDALSDAKELAEEDFDKASYGANKAKDVSKLFRLATDMLAEHSVTLLVISQIRDKIGVAFGERYSRSGGKALDFYSSVVVYLAKLGSIKKTKNKIERKIGFRVRATNKKSKVGLPGRVIDYPVIYGFGVDDLRGNVEWLSANGKLSEIALASDKEAEKFLDSATKLSHKDYRKECRRVAKITKAVWQSIENDFLPKHRKY